MPTQAQAFQSVILCQWLSNGFQPIYIFRYDSKYQTLYIQAGTTEDIAILIYPSGEWEFF